jgi:hypothetical protein
MSAINNDEVCISKVLASILNELSVSKDEPFETLPSTDNDEPVTFSKMELISGLDLFLKGKLTGTTGKDMYEICIANIPLSVFQKVDDMGFLDLTGLFFETAAMKGRLDLIQWRDQLQCVYPANAYNFTSSIAPRAAFGGHTHILEWLEKSLWVRLVWYDNLCEMAASGGQLDTLKFLRNRGSPWGRTLFNAVRYGYEEIAHWALENGCPSDVIIHAINSVDSRIARLRDDLIDQYDIPLPFSPAASDDDDEY